MWQKQIEKNVLNKKKLPNELFCTWIFLCSLELELKWIWFLSVFFKWIFITQVKRCCKWSMCWYYISEFAYVRVAWIVWQIDQNKVIATEPWNTSGDIFARWKHEKILTSMSDIFQEIFQKSYFNISEWNFKYNYKWLNFQNKYHNYII